MKDVFLENVVMHHPDLAVSVQLENNFDQFIRDTSEYFVMQMEEIDNEMKSEDIGYEEASNKPTLGEHQLN